MFNFNNKDTADVFFVQIEHISLFPSVSFVDFEQLNVCRIRIFKL